MDEEIHRHKAINAIDNSSMQAFQLIPVFLKGAVVALSDIYIYI